MRCFDRHPMLTGLAAAMLGILLLSFLPGCGEAGGLKFTPKEAQRQEGQVTKDLAFLAARHGLPPDSAAADRLAEGAASTGLYMGPPNQSISVAPYADEVKGRWENLSKRVDGMTTQLKFKNQILASSMVRLADFAKSLGANVKAGHSLIRAAEVASLLQGVSDSVQFTDQVAGSVAVPDEIKLTPAQQAQLDALNGVLADLKGQADKLNAAKPTVSDVATYGLQQASWWYDHIDAVAGISAIPFVGLVGGYIKKARDVALAKQDADAAQAAADTSGVKADQLQKALGQVVNQVDAVKGTLAGNEQFQPALAIVRSILAGQDPATQQIVAQIRSAAATAATAVASVVPSAVAAAPAAQDPTQPA